MSKVLLDTDKVNQMLSERGLKIRWVAKQVGLSHTAGYVMFRDGVIPRFPRSPGKREEMLKKLATMLGVQVDEIVVDLVSRKSA